MSSTLVTTEAGSAAAGLRGRQRRRHRQPAPGPGQPDPAAGQPAARIAAVRDRLQQRPEGRLRRLGAGHQPRELPLRLQQDAGRAEQSRTPERVAVPRVTTLARDVRDLVRAIARLVRAVLRTLARWRCSRSRAPPRAGAVILPAVDARRAERGHRRLRRRRDGRRRHRRGRLPQARRRRGARVRLALRRRALAGADPGRQRRAVRRQLAADRRRRTAASSSSCGRRRSRPRTSKPVDELLGATARPGRLDASARRSIIDPDIGEATGTSPDLAVSSTGQADVVYRVVADRASRTSRCCARATSSSRCASRTSTAQRWSSLGAINRNPGASMRPPTPANAPQIGDRPDRQRGRRLAGARHRRRRADLGAADVRHRARLRAAGQRDELTTAPRSATTPTRRAWRSRGSGQAEVAYRQTAGPGSPLPGPRIFLNILPGRRIGRAAPSSRAPASSTPPSSGGKRRGVGPPEHRHRRKAGHAPALRQQRHAARDRRQRPRARPARSRSAPPFVGRANRLRGERHEPRRRRRLGLAERRTRRGTPPSRCARTSPAAPCRRRSSAAARAAKSANWRSVARGSATGWSPSGRGRSATRRSSRRRPRAPPAQFVAHARPKAGSSPRRRSISWLAAPSADGPLSYHVVLDGRRPADARRAPSLRASTRAVSAPARTACRCSRPTRRPGDAHDRARRCTSTGVPPTVKITRAHGGAAVSVRVSDAVLGRGQASGERQLRRRQRRARARTLSSPLRARGHLHGSSSHVRDRIGNQGVVRDWVSVR